jgi:glycosyltransferase involved in cell wall biosynthesis
MAARRSNCTNHGRQERLQDDASVTPSRRPTILQIIPRLETGGAERTVVEVCQAITCAGGRALVATEGGRLAKDVEAAGGEIVALRAASKSPLQIAANAQSLVRLVREHEIDLLHARSRAPAWSALLAARRAGVPFVTTYHGAYSEKGRLKNLYNSVMARADRVIANSGFTADLIRSRYGTDATRIRVIPRGIDPAAYDRAAIAPERIAALRAAWNISPETRVVLHAARLSPPKGQTVVIDAAGRLGLAFPGGLSAQGPIAVVLAGDAQGRDDYVRDLDVRIAAHRLGNVVRRVGHVADMAAAYALAYVALLPSITPEAFGRASIEAQASGVPVIAACIGAQPETVLAPPDAAAGTETGWLVPPNDADALAGALSEALAMPVDQHSAMARRARAHVTTHFTLQRLQVQTLRVYDELLGTRLTKIFEASI